MSSGVFWRRSFSNRNWMPCWKQRSTLVSNPGWNWTRRAFERDSVDADVWLVWSAPDLFRVHVELLPPHGNLFVSLCGFTAIKHRNLHQVKGEGVASTPGYCVCSVGQAVIDCDVAWLCLFTFMSTESTLDLNWKKKEKKKNRLHVT